MTARESIRAVVAAGGSGARMGAELPKQYLPLGDARVVDYALAALCAHREIVEVLIAVAADDAHWRAQPHRHAKLRAEFCGAATRAATVHNALDALLRDGAPREDWVMVHDAARPCLRAADLDKLIDAARQHGDGALLAAPLHDSLKRARADGRAESADDDSLWRALTPQMYRLGALHDALTAALDNQRHPRDETQAMEWRGVHGALVVGDADNLKITVRADLARAERLVRGG